MPHETFLRERRATRKALKLPRPAVRTRSRLPDEHRTAFVPLPSGSRKSPRCHTPAPSVLPRAKSSRPLPVQGEYIEDVLMEKSGRVRRKSMQVQFLNPGRAASCKRRNDLLADPIRVAYSRHPIWVGAPPAPPRPEHIPAPALPRMKRRTRAVPLRARVPLLRHAQCRACLLLIEPIPVPPPATFVPRMKLESDFVEPANLPDLLA